MTRRPMRPKPARSNALLTSRRNVSERCHQVCQGLEPTVNPNLDLATLGTDGRNHHTGPAGPGGASGRHNTLLDKGHGIRLWRGVTQESKSSAVELTLVLFTVCEK